MKDEMMKTTVYSVFKDGKLLGEDNRQDITEKVVFFPESLAVAKVSFSASAPINC